MKTANYRGIFYFISLTIIITIGVQFYWNYNNYQLNRQRVANEIQLSLDNALEEYYAEIAKTDFLTIYETSGARTETPDQVKRTKDSVTYFSTTSTPPPIAKHNVQVIVAPNQSHKSDSMILKVQRKFMEDFPEDSLLKDQGIKGFTQWNESGEGFTVARDNGVSSVKVLKGKYAYDTLRFHNIIKPILISFQRDSLDYQQIDSLLSAQLSQKNIQLTYQLIHTKSDSLIYTSQKKITQRDPLEVKAKSTYLKPQEQINLRYERPFYVALKRSFFGIFISLLLALAIIFCLFYLLKIIKQQKQLAEIKNDLISNITHEFKTPITTISVAVESIKDFNVIDSREKTNSYLDISTTQLSKLNTMVEKLLETATLDSEGLDLQVEEINIAGLLHDLVERHRLQAHSKQIHFKSTTSTECIEVDPFHMENALNNLIDNAFKYGGDQITVALTATNKLTRITISDNGHSLTSAHKTEIFEKFYRVPSGNRHDVKGFGIGLYYTKKIVEKHGGTIALTLNKKSTDFIITLLKNG